jgi:hypothetical protein
MVVDLKTAVYLLVLRALDFCWDLMLCLQAHVKSSSNHDYLTLNIKALQLF